jgi:AcrR family transcriptional regulator
LSTQSVLERSYPGRRALLKREILASSLGCFNDQGIEATTIEVIKAACSTSVGAIYHHFGNKDGLIAALFFCAQDDQTQLLNSYLSKAHTGQDGVYAMVFSYLDWVTSEPELARFQFQARSFVAKGPHAESLAERNKSRNKALMAWLSQPERKASLTRCPPELLPSLIIGQSESYCRAWLAGRVRTSPEAYRQALAAAAWGSIEAMTAQG